MFTMFSGGVFQGFIVGRSRSLLRWCNYRHYDLVNSISMSQMTMDLCPLSQPQSRSSFLFHELSSDFELEVTRRVPLLE
jgi:hypothetical protein